MAGLRTVGKVGYKLMRGVGKYVVSPMIDPIPRHGARFAKALGKSGKALAKGDLQQLGKASMELLGTSMGVTYMARMAKGRSVFRDKHGRRDIAPWIPFI